MYLTHKFVGFSCKASSKIHCSSINSSVLCLEKMPNGKSKVTRGLLSGPKVQVVGGGAVGSPSNVILISKNIKYLINCGEGSLKLGSEYRFNLPKINQIFITSPTWKNLGGLVSVALSNQKGHFNVQTIHGHNCIENVFYGASKFINVKYNQPKIKRTQHNAVFSDGNLSVKYIHLYSSSRSTTPDKGESSEIENKVLEGSSSLGSVNCNLSKIFQDDEKESQNKNESSPSRKFVISYIFQTSPIKGSLLLEKCVEFGVPPGHLLGILKDGKNVTLADGTVVKSSDVTNPDLPGSNIIAVEIPTVDYLESLLKEPIYSEYQSEENAAALVIHFSSAEMVKNPSYQQWINSFSRKTRHLFLNENNKSIGSVGIHRLQFKLNYLQPSLFPLLQNCDIPDYPLAENSAPDEGHILLHDLHLSDLESVHSNPTFYKCESNSFINAESLCTVTLHPTASFDYSKCLVLKKEVFLTEMFEKHTKEKIEKFRESLRKLDLSLEENKRVYPKIVFLGTGSSIPSKVRNSSGILIFLEEDKCIIFDCAEGTFNQLVNLYGAKKTQEILRNLDAIFVSHLHADHHLGLITLLKERKSAFDKEIELLKNSNAETQIPEFKPVYLLAPLPIFTWLKMYSDNFDNILDLYVLLSNNSLEENNREVTRQLKDCKKELNLRDVKITSVVHCKNAFGISITQSNGCKITYSGDTRPCESLVKLGMNSDILIHEATFDDANVFDAKAKNHSTTGEALSVGKEMNAKFILLTHFSQRYCYLPVIADYLKNLNIGVAFDFMEVPFYKLKLLPELLEPLRLVFSEYDVARPFNEKMLSEECVSDSSEKPAKIRKKF